jgi:hypothetical protein
MMVPQSIGKLVGYRQTACAYVPAAHFGVSRLHSPPVNNTLTIELTVTFDSGLFSVR